MAGSNEAPDTGWLKRLFGQPLTAEEQTLVDAWDAAWALRAGERAQRAGARREAQAALVRQLRRRRQ